MWSWRQIQTLNFFIPIFSNKVSISVSWVLLHVDSELHVMKHQTFPCFLDLLVFEISFMKIDMSFGKMMLSRGTVFSIINKKPGLVYIYIYIYIYICLFA